MEDLPLKLNRPHALTVVQSLRRFCQLFFPMACTTSVIPAGDPPEGWHKRHDINGLAHSALRQVNLVEAVLNTGHLRSDSSTVQENLDLLHASITGFADAGTTPLAYLIDSAAACE